MHANSERLCVRSPKVWGLLTSTSVPGPWHIERWVRTGASGGLQPGCQPRPAPRSVAGLPTTAAANHNHSRCQPQPGGVRSSAPRAGAEAACARAAAAIPPCAPLTRPVGAVDGQPRAVRERLVVWGAGGQAGGRHPSSRRDACGEGPPSPEPAGLGDCSEARPSCAARPMRATRRGGGPTRPGCSPMVTFGGSTLNARVSYSSRPPWGFVAPAAAASVCRYASQLCSGARSHIAARARRAGAPAGGGGAALPPRGRGARPVRPRGTGGRRGARSTGGTRVALGAIWHLPARCDRHEVIWGVLEEPGYRGIARWVRARQKSAIPRDPTPQKKKRAKRSNPGAAEMHCVAARAPTPRASSPAAPAPRLAPPGTPRATLSPSDPRHAVRAHARPPNPHTSSSARAPNCRNCRAAGCGADRIAPCTVPCIQVDSTHPFGSTRRPARPTALCSADLLGTPHHRPVCRQKPASFIGCRLAWWHLHPPPPSNS
jgi:hypothetical protein